MSAEPTLSSFYVLGGTLKRDAPSYVQRRADVDLYSALKGGRFCYVLTSRQMGKSSLIVRAAVRLRQEGAKVAVLDLTSLGQNLSVEQWYLGLLGHIGTQLDIEDELEDFWNRSQALGPLQRWMGAIREELLVRVNAPVVIFIDEIDATRSLPFFTDEFFAGIREFYNERAETAALERLTFCLSGVATPSDLIENPRTTPFNIGERIDLTDFNEAEAKVLLPGLKRPEQTAYNLLRRILHWTGGQPYLTQRLCQAVGEDPSITDSKDVDRICKDIFLSTKARERDDNLLFVRDRMLRGSLEPVALLTLYSQVLAGARVKDDPAHPLISVLRLSGVVRVEDGYLRIRNRIYRQVFNKQFVAMSLPVDEVQRQHAAERRGRMKVLRVAVPVSALFLVLTFIALQQRHDTNVQRTRAEEAGARAVAAQQAAERYSQELKKSADEGLRATAEIASEVNAASKKHPDLLGTYAKSAHLMNNFADTMFKLEPLNYYAADLKVFSKYLLADAAAQAGDWKGALRYSQESLLDAKQFQNSSDIRIRAIAARTYAFSADISARQGDRADAQTGSALADTLAQNLASQVEASDDFTLRTLAWIHRALGGVDDKLDRRDLAVKHYSNAVEFDAKARGDNSQAGLRESLATSNAIGAIQLKQKHYAAARKSYEVDALPIARKLAASGNQGQGDLWDALNNVGNVLSARKQTRAEAVPFYAEAVAAGEKVVQADPSTLNREKLETTLLSLAQVEKMLHHFAQARTAYQARIVSVQERVKKEPSLNNVLILADAYDNLGDFEARAGGKAAAVEAYQKEKSVMTANSKYENEIGVQRRLARASLQIGNLGSVQQSYVDAQAASQKYLDLVQKAHRSNADVAFANESLALSKLASGDRDGAALSLKSALEAAEAAAKEAGETLSKRNDDTARSRAATAYGSLGWFRLLNNRPRESIDASLAALKLEPDQALAQGNLAHAYLLTGQMERARAIYQASRGEEVNGDVSEHAVFDDFALLRKLGLGRPEMVEIEKLLGK